MMNVGGQAGRRRKERLEIPSVGRLRLKRDEVLGPVETLRRRINDKAKKQSQQVQQRVAQPELTERMRRYRAERKKITTSGSAAPLIT